MKYFRPHLHADLKTTQQNIKNPKAEKNPGGKKKKSQKGGLEVRVGAQGSLTAHRGKILRGNLSPQNVHSLEFLPYIEHSNRLTDSTRVKSGCSANNQTARRL